MSNPLTGDFDAVVQVSEATLNRLAATMHQNAGTDPDHPSFPHGAALRIGDPHPFRGLKGSAWAQLGVPRLTLLNESEDRFRLEVGVRARYKADPGSTPLPELIHGTITADYRLEPVAPDCPGYRTTYAQYVWIRVDGDSVAFTGTAEDDTLLVLFDPPDPAEADALITLLARMLLQTRYAATPHRVSERFRAGAMRSLNHGGGRSVVAVPVALGGGAPAGNIHSLHEVFAGGGGDDLAVAISRDVFVRPVQSALDDLRRDFSRVISFHHRTYIDLGWFGDVDVVDIDISWGIGLTKAHVTWLGVPLLFPDTMGFLQVTLSGAADTEGTEYDIGFDVTQYLLIGFDPGAEAFTVQAAGPPVVAVHAHGPFSDAIESYVKPFITTQVMGQVQAVLASMGGLAQLGPRKADLVDQLRTIDPQAGAHLDRAQFSDDGVVVRGRIAGSPRARPTVAFATLGEQDGFTALESWIPGGRVDTFEWSWRWFGTAPPGSAVRTDRYLLRRPRAARGPFGHAVGLRDPLPGLDGMGSLCLTVTGVQVDAVSGALVPVRSTRLCRRFGFDVRTPTRDQGRLVVRVAVEEQPGELVDLGPPGHPGTGLAVNTLVLPVGERFDADAAAALQQGLAGVQRTDAGLVVLALLTDGALGTEAGRAASARIAELATELAAPVVVGEDVGGAWATTLSPDGDAGGGEWTLLSPTGGVAWSHPGTPGADDLSAALEEHLFAGGAPALRPLSPIHAIGDRIGAVDFDPLLPGLLEPHCPPVPIGRIGAGRTVALFVRDGAERVVHEVVRAAAAVAERAGEPTPAIVLVVEGASEREGDELPPEVIRVPDPEGRVTRRFGVQVWPTTLALDGRGVVTGVSVGTDHLRPAEAAS